MGVDLTKKRAYEDMCEDCRDDRHPGDTASFCVCPPKPECGPVAQLDRASVS